MPLAYWKIGFVQIVCVSRGLVLYESSFIVIIIYYY